MAEIERQAGEGNQSALSQEEQRRTRPKRVGNALQNLAHDITYGELDDRTAAEIVREHWQKLVGLIALVMLAIWTWESVKVSQAKSAGEISERFSAVQAMYDSRLARASASPDVKASTSPDVKDSDDESSDDANSAEARALSDSIKGLLSGSGIYGEAAPLYAAIDSMERGNYEETRKILSQFSPQKLEAQAVQPLRKERLTQELAALLDVRAELLQVGAGNAEAQSAVRERLKRLTEVGSLVSGEAALSLLRLSETTAQRDQAVDAVQSLLRRRPEMREALASELEIYGIETE